MLVYEGLAAGVPLLIHPQQRDQLREVGWLAERGCLLDLGPKADAPEVDACVRALLRDPERRRALASRGSEVVDGRGMERAAEALAHLLREGSA